MNKKGWFYISQRDVDDKFERIVYGERDNLPSWSSRYGGYATKEELLSNIKLADFECCKCNGLININYDNAKDLIANKMCFKCNFYKKVKEVASVDKKRLIINHASYHNSGNSSDGGFKGFGGRQFKYIRFDDPTTVVTTNNLWHQGEIPKIWQDEIPNNAQWVKE